MKQAQETVALGTILDGKFRVDDIVGRGGMGTVYRAQHLALHEPVAIKVLHADAAADDEILTRFLREAQWAAKLRSEHVARIHDVGTTAEGLPYMVMELLEGADLGQLVEQNGALYPPIAVDLVLQACDALVEAHSLGIVHRDIKPTNLFVSYRPDHTAIVKVLDFGISKAAAGSDLSLTQTQSMLGTPAYMSPEQMRSARDVDQRTDIWSLGTVLYELVEARRPFQAESFSEMCVMVAVDPPQPLTNAPELTEIITRCLEKAPAQRYANVAELMAALAPFAHNPDAARYYVTRAQRVLGLRDSQPMLRPSTPSLTESGPIALVTPAPMPIAQLTMSGPRALAISTLSSPSGPTRVDRTPAHPLAVDRATDLRPRRGLWVAAIAVLLVAGGGFAVWKITREDAPADRVVVSREDAPSANPSTPPLAEGSGSAATTATTATTEPTPTGGSAAGSGASTVAGTGSGAGSAEEGAGSGSASTHVATVTKPPGKKPPQKKLPKKPVKKPEVTQPPPDKPPIKKCDPFDSRVKC